MSTPEDAAVHLHSNLSPGGGEGGRPASAEGYSTSTEVLREGGRPRGGAPSAAPALGCLEGVQRFRQAHEPATSSFRFIAVRPPEHRVALKVVDKDTGVSLDAVELRLGMFRVTTDEKGIAQVDAAIDAAKISMRIDGDGARWPKRP